MAEIALLKYFEFSNLYPEAGVIHKVIFCKISVLLPSDLLF